MSEPTVPSPPDDLPAQAAATIRAETGLVPRFGIVLGSGLGPSLGEHLKVEASFAFDRLAGFPRAAVPGHAGQLVLGRLAGEPVAVFFGRIHFYEGHGMDVPALLPRLAHELGASTMVVTAAVGGLVPALPAGSVVVLTDHINMMGTAPLRGWRFPDGMPAFVSMADVYDSELAELALDRAGALDVLAAKGVYAAMSGPAYETPSEVAFLRQAGATVVGMSMVPEASPARALGMRVLGLCSVTNAVGEHVEHEDVVKVSNRTAAAIGRLLVDLLPRMATTNKGA